MPQHKEQEAAIDAETIANSKIDKTSIVHGFGNDPAKVMSQKVITDNISQILQLEGRNFGLMVFVGRKDNHLQH